MNGCPAFAVVCAIVASLSLGSCGDARGGSNADRADAAVTLELWTLSLRPTFTDYIERTIEGFESEHPGVEVVWVDVPFGAVERKLVAAAAAGRAPDVINMSDLMFARFAGARAFAALDGVLPGDAAGRYHAGALDVGRIGGELYALPWYLTTQTMIVNTDLLEAGGLTLETVATDWPGLREQAIDFAEPGERSLFTQPLGQDSQLLMMLLADGLPPFAEDAGGALRADLTRGEVVDFIRGWVEVYRSGALPRAAATNGFEHLIEVYQNERVAVLNTGANFLGRVRGVSQRVYDSSAVLPPITGSLGRAHIAVMSLSVSAQSEHPELASALAWHLTSPEAQLDFCRLATILPSTPASLSDPFFAGATPGELESGDAKVAEARAVVARALPGAVAFTPAMEAWPEMRRVFEDGIKRVLLAPADAPGDLLESQLASIESRWNGLIDAMNTARVATGGRAATMDAIPTPTALPSADRAGAAGPAR